MTSQRFPLGLRETRLVALKGYPGDVTDTYFKKGPLGWAAGAVSLGVEGTDQALRRLSGREYEAPKGIAGHIRRDLSALFEHVKEGEPLKAATAGLSIVSGDLVMDTVDVLGGFRNEGSYSTAA